MAPTKPYPDTGFRAAKIPAKPPAKTGAIPPPPAPPAPRTKPAASAGAAFNQFINAHPSMRPYADTIWKWSKTYGVDQVVMATLFWRESFAAAKAQGKDPATIVSPAGAVGVGQIMPLHVGEKTPWGHTVTQSDLVNPDFNIRWSSWFFSQQIAKYGDANSAYNKGYNPGYTGPDLTSLLPKGYVPRAGLSPTDKGTVTAETQAATAAAKAQVFDKWAVLDPKGRVAFVSIKDPSAPPKNALTYAGTPLTQSTFNQVWQQNYQDTFFAYTGRQAKGTEIQKILAASPSIYTLANQLAGGKDIQNSPVWKQHAPGLIGLARTILGQGWKPSGGIIRQAIAQNWDQATFEQHLRELPAYRQGPEFKDNQAKTQQVYESIYGKADPGAQKLIADVTAQGWTPDEFASWLRSQDAYTATPEYQSKQVSFLQALGLITGAPATLTGDQVTAMQNNAPTDPFAPNPGASPKRPDNRPGPRGANPGGVSPPTNPTPAAPVRPNDRPGPYGPGR